MYPPHLQACRVTASTISGPTGASSALGPSMYLSYTQQVRGDYLTPRDREPCLVMSLDGSALSAGYYLCRLVGSYTDLPVYAAIPAAAGGSGITSINDDTTVSQTIGLGTAGTDINITTTAAAYSAGVTYSRGMIVSSGGATYRYSNATPSSGNAPPNATYWVVVTGDGLNIINIPDAATDTDGLVNTVDQAFLGKKTFSNYAIGTAQDIDFRWIGGSRTRVFITESNTANSNSTVLIDAAMNTYTVSSATFLIGGNMGLTSGMTAGAGQAGFHAYANVTISDVSTAWATSNSYVGGRTYVTNGGNAYRCYVDHTSAAANEPGSGADWQLYWVQLSSASGTVDVSPLMNITDDAGTIRLCKTGAISGLEFVGGWCVGGTLDLTTTTLPYTPAVTGDWSGADPTTVAEALDRIAAMLGPIT